MMQFDSCRPPPVVNALSVDVEDYYHAAALSAALPRAKWNDCESRVDANTRRVLELLAAAEATATFFVLGSIAQRNPRLIRAIVAAGHEIASHGYAHFRIDEQSAKAFAEDVTATRRILEDIAGRPVAGYRAASFSIAPGTWWAYEVLAECGYTYSSSINPIRHDHYGIPDAPRFAFTPAGTAMVELPVSTVSLAAWRLPCSGGGYFRLLPYAVSRVGLRHIRRERQPAVFYFHPWEIDPDQPRAPIGGRSRFRHYVNLRVMEAKLSRLLQEFSWSRFDRVFAGLLDRRSVATRRLPAWRPS